MVANGWFDADDPDVRVAFLQVTPDARYRAARADAGKEVIESAAGLAPDFRAGRVVVRGDVELTLVLVWADVLAAIGLALDHAFDNTARTFGWVDGAQFVLNFDEFGTEEPEQRFLFLRYAIRNRDFDRRSLGVGERSEGDARVSRRGLDQRLVGAKLQAIEHEHGGTIFDRPKGIHALEFYEELEVRVRIEALSNTYHRRRVIGSWHQVYDAVVNFGPGPETGFQRLHS